MNHKTLTATASCHLQILERAGFTIGGAKERHESSIESEAIRACRSTLTKALSNPFNCFTVASESTQQIKIRSTPAKAK